MKVNTQRINLQKWCKQKIWKWAFLECFSAYELLKGGDSALVHTCSTFLWDIVLLNTVQWDGDLLKVRMSKPKIVLQKIINWNMLISISKVSGVVFPAYFACTVGGVYWELSSIRLICRCWIGAIYLVDWMWCRYSIALIWCNFYGKESSRAPFLAGDFEQK